MSAGTYIAALRGPVRFSQAWPSFIRTYKRYGKFSGRASLSEYLWFTVVNIALIAAVMLAIAFIGGAIGLSSTRIGTVCGGVYDIWVLAVFVPSLAIAVRRLHDVGKSGKVYFWSFVPFGVFYVLALILRTSDDRINAYGPPDPL